MELNNMFRVIDSDPEDANENVRGEWDITKCKESYVNTVVSKTNKKNKDWTESDTWKRITEINNIKTNTDQHQSN